MKLLHGSYMDIQEPDLSFCHSKTDFGKGFYLTTDWRRAWLMGKRKSELMGINNPTVNVFLFYESQAIDNGCNIKKFKGFTLEWGRFILANRDNEGFIHNYDIVIGPVADEAVNRKIEEHKETYGDNYLEDYAIRDFINQVTQFGTNYVQYCFCTQLAINQLIKS